MTRVLVVLGMVLLCAPALADQKYDLKLNMSEGDISRYQISTTGSIKAKLPGTDPIDMPYTISMVYTQGVKKISAKGNYVLEAKVEKMVATMMGQTTDAPPDQLPDMTMLVTPKGRLLDQKGMEQVASGFGPSAGTGGFGNMMSSFNHNCASFPEKPVSVGYTWNTDLSQLAQMFGKMSKAAACKNKFAAVETVNGRQCARIESSVHLPLNLTGEQLGLPKGGDMKFTAQIDMTSWFTLATGNLHKSKGKVSVSGVGDVSDGNGPAQHIEFSMDFNMDVNEIAGIAAGKTASYKTPSSMLPTSSTPNKSSVIRTNG